MGAVVGAPLIRHGEMTIRSESRRWSYFVIVAEDVEPCKRNG